MIDVATPSHEVEEMAANIELAEALMGGTSAMRKAAEKHLPRWPNEEPVSYAARLKVATLFPAYQRTVLTLTGKPFSKPITVGDDVPAQIKALLPVIDSEGRNLDAFGGQAMQTALAYGLGGILVDYPRTDGAQTRADEVAMKARPYFVLVKPDAIIGWRTERSGALWRLTQLRLSESVKELDGAYGEKEVDQVRVLSPGAWEIHRKNDKGEWVLFDQGLSTLPEIPFVPIYGQRDEFMEAKPPLLEVAHLNVQHWQSASDQQTLLHVARVPILTLIGAEDTAVTVGASSAVKLPLGADMKFVEHSGAAIAAGRQDLIDLEERMRQAGAELLVLAPGKITATQVNTENAVGMCALQRITLDLQDAINTALQFMARWMGLPSGGSVKIFNDFGAATLAEASAELLLKTNQAGKISDATLLTEYQRRGILSASTDPETERSLIAEQGPALGMIADPVAPDPAPAADPVAAPAAAPAPDFAAFAAVIADALRQVVINSPAVTVEAQPAAQITMPAISVAPAAVTVNVPEQPASVVNIAPPAITVEAPQVTVNNEAAPAPQVTVNTPDVTVHAPPVNVRVDRAGMVKFNEDAAGNIVGATLE